MKKINGLILWVLFSFFIVSCYQPNNNEETTVNNFDVPALANITISSLNSYSAVASCNILNEGSAPVTVRGICYGTRVLPFAYDTNNITIQAGSGTGSFTVNLTGLQNDTTYYIRAYGQNLSGVGYSNIISFTPSFVVGQNYQGGILFYLDKTNHHGYIAAPSDQGMADWGCAGTSISGANNQTAVGAGQQNTIDIVQGCTTSGIAAGLCENLTLGGYSGWFLPSSGELNLLYGKKDTVGGFTNGYYWSSSEYDANNAFYQNFAGGAQTYSNKSTQASVRAIRAF